MYFGNLLKSAVLLQLVFILVIFADEISINGDLSIKKGEVARLFAEGSCENDSLTYSPCLKAGDSKLKQH